MANQLAKPEQPFLVQFFDPQIAAKDFKGRTLRDLLAFDDEQLEYCHDYIQILFPLPEGSMFNWQSPIIDKATFEAFRSRQDLRDSFEKCFQRIMAFYGFDVSIKGKDQVEVTRSANYHKSFRNWVVRMDHNHLRISRIVRSLRVLGLEAHGAAFHKAILKVNEEFPNRIGARSMMYWRRAAERPLYLPPDEDDDDAKTGPKFLLEYEASKTDGA